MTVTPESRKRVLDPEGKKAQILAAARQLFALRRYEDVSVPEIVKLAGVAQGTFYRYFPAKTDVIAALTAELDEHIAQAFETVLGAGGTLTEVLERAVWTLLSVTETYRDVLPLLDTEALLFGHSNAAEARREPFLARIAVLIAGEQKQGRVAGSLKPEWSARLVGGVLDRLARDVLLGREALPREAYVEEALGFISRALGVVADSAHESPS